MDALRPGKQQTDKQTNNPRPLRDNPFLQLTRPQTGSRADTSPLPLRPASREGAVEVGPSALLGRIAFVVRYRGGRRPLPPDWPFIHRMSLPDVSYVHLR